MHPWAFRDDLGFSIGFALSGAATCSAGSFESTRPTMPVSS
jgi:hypothetical protein